jgi:hypothetical protein
MQIEEGKFYRTRDGRKVGPVYEQSGAWVSDETIDDFEPMWNLKNGVANFFSDRYDSDYPEHDLIAEWTESQDDNSAALAAQYGIIITVTVGELKITYDGRSTSQDT